jgi:hypothetical protein
LKVFQKKPESWPSIRILKQKFGTLRVQFDKRVSEHIEALITKAYKRSMEACELCGAPAKLDSEREFGKWVEALCENCRKAQQSQLSS